LGEDDLDHQLIKSQVLGDGRASINRNSDCENVDIEEEKMIVKARPSENIRDTFMVGQDAEAQRRVFEVQQVYDKKDQEHKYCDNRIATSKYNCLTFFPKNLFH
jgi:hypothetical protein